LTVVGRGHTQWAAAEAEAAGVTDLVRFVSTTPDPWSSLAGSHISLICSEAEAMGRVTAESLVAGVPVVGTRGGATDELLGNGTRGELVDRAPEAVADAIRRIWNDYGAAQQRADDAAEWARETFSTERYAKAVSEVYERLAG